MPKMSPGGKGSANVIGCAVKVMRVATGEEPNDRDEAPTPSRAAQPSKLGGIARARKLTAEQRTEIARKGAAKRWGKG
jgi:hypothetical protein